MFIIFIIIISVIALAFYIMYLNSESSDGDVKAERQRSQALIKKIQQERAAAGKGSKWHNDRVVRFLGDNDSVVVDNIRAEGPLIYFAFHSDGPALAHVIYGDGSGMNKNEHTLMLTWLASGKKSYLPVKLLLKYLYGLEYRVIVDKTDQMRMLNEAVTLHNRHYSTPSFAPALEGFIAYLILKIRTFNSVLKQRLLAVMDRAPLDSPLFQSGAHLVVENRNISKLSLLRAAIPRKTLYSDYRKEELNTLFQGLAEELAPTLEEARERFSLTEAFYSYQPALPISLPLGKTKEKGLVIRLAGELATELQAAWFEGLETLKKSGTENKVDKKGIAAELLDYIKSKRKVPLEELNLDLPQEKSQPKERRKNFWEKAVDRPCEMSELARELNYAACNRLAEWESKAIAQTLAERGYNIEPDARYTRRGYRWNEQVIFYPAEKPSPPQSRDYDTALLLFKLGLYIAEADGEVDPEELTEIEKFIKKSVCKEDEDRARVDRVLLLAQAGALKPEASIKKLLLKLTAKEKSAVGRYLFVIAAADEIIDSLELEKIEHIFSRLGLTKKELNRSLEEFGLKEPPEPGITLDPERLQKIMEETDRVQDILGKLFSDDEPELPEPSTDETAGEEAADEPPVIEESVEETLAKEPISEETTETIAKEEPPTTEPIKDIQQKEAAAEDEYNLPPEVEAFMRRILERESWGKSELRKIAMEKGLMLENSLEQINFWCEEQTGDYLVYEEGERYTVQRELLDEWRSLY